MSRIFDDLNPVQAGAVKNIDGPSLVIAGAGSGKTRVLTYRVAYLLEKGISASSILALTFTNKAASEMKSRIENILGSDVVRYLWMGTFHSMFARILRKESYRLGYPSTYTIYDTDDSKSLVRSIIRELQLDDKIYKTGEVFGRISSAKNNLITPQLYYNNNQIKERDRITRRPMLGEIFKLYASRCKKAGAMDFDDLLLNTNILFRDFPEILKKYQEKFHYILVDEYQDTNYSQYLIVKRLGDTHKNVCVVGDDAQSIYSFRGAKIENILNFKNDYPGYTLYKLEQNYRSTQNIVNAANSIIDKNRDQIKKTVFSKNSEGDKIRVVRTLTDVEEGFMVSNAILDTSLSSQLQYSDFAILYRTNAQSRIFEEALRKRNIPYKVYGSISFYQRKEIKDIIAYFRLIVNENDDESLKRIINYPVRGIGKTTLGKLEEEANAKDISIWKVISETEENSLGMNRGTLSKLSWFAEFISGFQKALTESDAYTLAMQVVTHSGIMKELHSGNTPEERSKFENLEALLNGIKDFVTAAREEGEPTGLQNYIENVALLTDADSEKEEDRNKVSIMTIHSAKGLEFNHIFITGVEEELFPSALSLENLKDLEEERRLFYVAVTRAKKNVTISYCQSRYKWGVPNESKPSRFLNDIDENYIDWPDNPLYQKSAMQTDNSIWDPFGNEKSNNHIPVFGARPRKISRIQQSTFTKPQANQPSNPNFIPSDPESIQNGMTVEHQRFGKGKVIHIEGVMPQKKATVFFQQIKQEKQLLLKFAKLRIVKEL
ncbi:MAG: UvrD-helicase domain-containing protein [Bacteroidales bacterium]|nr:UvrD-helicase domain-containing protein [Bacteroidales bacterium]